MALRAWWLRPTVLPPSLRTGRLELEITGAIGRYYSDADSLPGVPFDLVVTIVGDEGVAIIKGLKHGDTRMFVILKRLLMQKLKPLGFRKMIWRRRDRITGVEKRIVEVQLL